MRVLVTGGAGYIGSVVAAQLVAAGHEVTVLDDLSTGFADAVPPGATFVKGTLRDGAAEVLSDGIEAVLHFAAKSLVGESVADPASYWSASEWPSSSSNRSWVPVSRVATFRSYGPNGRRCPVRHLRAQRGGRGRWYRGCYEEKAKMVVELKVWPAASTVDGKLDWLGEFGKCWVSNVYAWV